MIRITRGNINSKKHKKYLHLAKGYVGANSRLSTLAMEQFIQSGKFSYTGRKLKKRDYRCIWIYRINAAVRAHNLNYSKFMGTLHKKNIFLNRKSLAYIAFHDSKSFNVIARLIKN